MTTQIPDSCTFDGRKWEIHRWIGDNNCVPSSEEFGFNTVSPHTANWSGRIDHFMVWNDRLFLFKIEVNFADGFQDFFPNNARREVILRYERMDVIDSDGARQELREYRTEYLIFDDLLVPYTGNLLLSFPYSDDWEHPLPIQEDIYEARKQIELSFVAGILTDYD